jgi:hypothetical protein
MQMTSKYMKLWRCAVFNKLTPIMTRDSSVSLYPWSKSPAAAAAAAVVVVDVVVWESLELSVVEHGAADNAAPQLYSTLDAPKSSGLAGPVRPRCYQARRVEAAVPQLVVVKPGCVLVRSCSECTIQCLEILTSRGKEGGHQATVHGDR